MRAIIFLTFTSLFLILVDLYLWWVLKKSASFWILKWLIPLSSIILVVSFAFIFGKSASGDYHAVYTLNFLVGLTFGVLISKLLMVTLFFMEDFVRVLTFLVEKIVSKQTVEISNRRLFVRNISLAIASIPIAGTLWGITRGKYHFLINRFELTFNDLPQSFDGFKIVQFTDFHAGSFDHLSEVARGLDLLQAEGGDVIVFTGDSVNNRAEELKPFIFMLKRLKATHGKFSILGNHDYGDYIPWNSNREREANLELLESYHHESDFKLLRNSNQLIERNGEHIAIVGVENWGKPPFPQYGDLVKAVDGIPAGTFKVLLSHDPDHWEYEVRHIKEKVQLTLSGHTHGAQFGIDIPGWKWSPVKYRYKRWLGLYKEDKRYLYVNRGFGFLGFPGRVGMRPEISVFTLRKSNKN